jgi:hypothetical protein
MFHIVWVGLYLVPSARLVMLKKSAKSRSPCLQYWKRGNAKEGENGEFSWETVWDVIGEDTQARFLASTNV